MNIFLENNTRFAKLCLNGLPSGYKSAESSKPSLLLFAIGILSLHDAEIDSKDEIISYLKSLYKISGFSGSLHSTTHIAMTYSALASLIICGDDLNWINKSAITNHLSTLQNEDGSFSCYKGGESDMRYYLFI